MNLEYTKIYWTEYLKPKSLTDLIINRSDEQIVVCSYNGILLSNKNEHSTDVSNHVDKLGYCDRNQSCGFLQWIGID